jgi:hypothetical protein
VRGELVARAEVSSGVQDEMFALLSGQFEGVSRPGFEADLAGKSHVVLLRSPDDGRLRGFSTIDIYRRTVEGARVGVVYSGDTVVDGGGGMGSSLSRIWIGAVNLLRREAGLERLWWLLLTSGYRTYRFLPMYWREFHPRWDAPIPAAAHRLREALAEDRFGSLFDPGTGVVRFPEPQVLRPGLAGIPAARLADPHVAFFARANPGHGAGDELVCLTELAESNLTPAGRRMWRGGELAFTLAAR